MSEKLVPKLRFDFNDDWQDHTFKELLIEVNEKTTVNNQHEILSSTKEGIFTQKEYFANRNVASKDNTGYKILRKNQIVLSPQNLWMGNINVNTEFEIGIVSPSYKIYETTDLIEIDYFKHIIKLPRLIYEYKCASEQGASIVRRNLNKQLFDEITISIPSLKEQQKIGKMLTLIDKKIELLENKHRYYQDFKKYLMQQIFAQKLRFANFTEEWKTVKIKDIFDERSEKGFSDLELLSVTLNDGVIKRSEIESKDNSNENKSNYKHVLPDDIVYNSMRMWQGASGVSSYEGIVSPAYTILIPKNAYSKFFGYYFKTNEMIHQFKKYSQGLTSDTWNLKYPLISEIKIKIPSIDEQKEITNVFETIDLKTKILQNNLEEVMTFKKGLLQQMFV